MTWKLFSVNQCYYFNHFKTSWISWNLKIFNENLFRQYLPLATGCLTEVAFLSILFNFIHHSGLHFKGVFIFCFQINHLPTPLTFTKQICFLKLECWNMNEIHNWLVERTESENSFNWSNLEILDTQWNLTKRFLNEIIHIFQQV